ncbi:HEPN domain-containing protein [Methanobrevibacter woesei]|uniref:HEPN domain-containing protein n=1 Tax=Methanobrevibacter woesei TaxID=190976 RepID=UPI0023F1AE62|nr:HEPN domain-containing protein [Methanobrevibacter woesei]
MSEITDYMDKVNTKLKSSKLLIELGDYSDSVSLSYYAMFLTAKALLIKKNIFPKTHSGLISTFGKEYVKDGTFNLEIYRNFARTQTLRETADYEAVDNISKRLAIEKITQAEEFVKEAKKFL